MGINRQVFLSLDESNNLTMTAAFNAIPIVNNTIDIGWGDSIEWLLAPNSGIQAIEGLIGISMIPDCINAFISLPQEASGAYYIVLSINGENVTYPSSGQYMINVSTRDATRRRPKAQIWNLYVAFKKPYIPGTVITSDMIGISTNPDGPFLDTDSFYITVYDGDVIIWQIASPPYSFGGYITGILPPKQFPLFASTIYTEGIGVAQIYSDYNKQIHDKYTFAAGINYPAGSTPAVAWLTIDPVIRVNPDPGP
jgi:hypothetical protein